MLSACGAPAPKLPPQGLTPSLNLNDPQAVAGASSIERDELGTTTIYRGPNAAKKHLDQLFIRARRTDAGSVSYQIYVVINYIGVWRFYNWAYDTNGNTLDLMLLSRNLDQCRSSDCAQNEHLSIDVTREYLEEHKQSGVRFWLSAKEEITEVLFIPPGYIKAFLSLPDKSHREPLVKP